MTRQRKNGPVVSQRHSPSRATAFQIFDELVHFVTVFPHERLTLEVLLVDVEEHRLRRKPRRWRGKDYRVQDRLLRSVEERREFRTAGDLLGFPDGWFGGYRQRSDIRAFPLLSEWFQQEIIPLELIDSRFYHLDTCFCPLSGGELLYFPAAFDEYGRRAITERLDPERLLPVIEPDALMEMGGLTEEQALHITEQAEARALEAEAAAAAERRRQKEQERIEAATREAERLEAESKARLEGTNGADGRAGGANRDAVGPEGDEAGRESAG